MGTGFAGRRTASQQLTEAFDRSGHDFGAQGPPQGLATHRLLKASGRVLAQPRTASQARTDHERSVGSHRQPDQIGRRRGPPAADARAAGGYAVISGSPGSTTPPGNSQPGL